MAQKKQHKNKQPQLYPQQQGNRQMGKLILTTYNNLYKPTKIQILI